MTQKAQSTCETYSFLFQFLSSIAYHFQNQTVPQQNLGVKEYFGPYNSFS